MGDLRLGKIIPQQTKRVGLAIVEQQQDLLNGDRAVYEEFTNNIDLIRVHLQTFDDDFKKTRGRLQDALKLLEKYIKRDFNFSAKRKGLKFDAVQQLFFVQHSELIVRGIIGRIVLPDKFRDFIDNLDLEFYSTICRKLSIQSTAPPSREVMKLAMNQIDESFQNIQINTREDDFSNCTHNDGASTSGGPNNETAESSLDIIRERLSLMNVDNSCREMLESQSERLVNLAKQFENAMRVTRSASPPRQNWKDFKEEDVKIEQLDETETEKALPTITVPNEKKEEVEVVEETDKKKVRFAVINTRNNGLYEAVEEVILFDQMNTSYRNDIGTNIAMRYAGAHCDIVDIMNRHKKYKSVVDMNTTIKRENAKESMLRKVIRDFRPDGLEGSKSIRTPLHLDLQPLDASNKFSDEEAQDYLVACARMITRFSSNWAGIKRVPVAEMTCLSEHETNVFGVLILTDSLFENIEPNFFLNGTIISLPPPFTLDDMLTILNKARYDHLFVREIVISFGHDILTYTEKVTDETVEEAVRATFQAVDRIEALFKKRRDEFLKLDPKFGMILDISTEVTKVRENPLPNFKILTIPEYGDRVRHFIKYNAAIRKILPFMKNCGLIDWAAHRSEFDREFMAKPDQGYDNHKIHVETRVRHLARILYFECFLLHHRKDAERRPHERHIMTRDSMV